MNYGDIRRKFEETAKTVGLDEYDISANRWINEAWELLSEEFEIKALRREEQWDSVKDQAEYALPYDYNGTEITLIHNRRVLDPVPERISQHHYEYQTSSKGSVRFYDLLGTMESDLETIAACTLAADSVDVTSTNKTDNCDLAYWVRFDDYLATGNKQVTAGDYGYRLLAGGLSGDTFKLQAPFRGDAGTGYLMRIQPAEQTKIRVYGIPTSAQTDVFTLVYSSRPKRLFADHHVPEMPQAGKSIAYRAISLGFSEQRQFDYATEWWKRAQQAIGNLRKRQQSNDVLIDELPVGSTTGRHIGPYSR